MATTKYSHFISTAPARRQTLRAASTTPSTTLSPYGVEALTDYWSRNVLTDEVKADLQRSGRGELYMDSLELSTYGRGGLFWGFTLRDEFKKRREYDVFPYLPFLVKHSEYTGAEASA